MRRSLPRLEQIEAFIEATGAPSFRVAAERCCLSPAAFSRRIQAFSLYSGLTLFERTAGGARLTAEGRRCLAELQPAYAELRRAAGSICQRDQQSVTLSLSHSLAVGWLIPRLDAFNQAHPGIELSLKTQRGAADIRCGDADLGICFSDVDLAGLEYRPLLDVTAQPVASPDMAAAFADGRARLEDYRLLSITSPAGLWSWWGKSTGTPTETATVSRFELIQAMYETASQGLGIAMGASPTVWPYLESNRLRILDLPSARFPGGYRLATVAERKRRAPVRAVWQWLEVQAEATPCFA